MSEDRIAGTVRKGVGRVQGAVGGLTGDTALQLRGKFNEAAGTAQDTVGIARDKAMDIIDELENYTKENPRTALALTLGAGVVLGLLLLGGSRVHR